MQYGLIGRKLRHSFSKTIHEYFADYEYGLKELEPNELDDFMRRADFKGINVTIPYKQAVMPYLYYIDKAAEKIGAVNTVVNRGGKLYGYNTDFGGLRRLLLKNGFEVKNKKVLVLGSGGTSKTACAVLADIGAKEVVTVSRNGEVNYNNVKTLHGDASYIVNTTPCGMYPNADTAAIDIDGFESLEGVADVVYNPLETKIVRQARQRGLKGCCGLYMLVSQAVLASEHFLDTRYDESVYEKTYNYVLSSKKNIVLTGMPGSGKSTIGKILADRLGRPFFDTDDMVVESENRPITDIFSSDGEEYFRSAETEAIRRASEKNGIIISTGGGAVLKKCNIDCLSSNGDIFFLNRPLEDIIPTSDRPLANSTSQLQKRFDERYPIYKSTADYEIFVDGIAQHAADEIIKKFLKEEKL